MMMNSESDMIQKNTIHRCGLKNKLKNNNQFPSGVILIFQHHLKLVVSATDDSYPPALHWG